MGLVPALLPGHAHAAWTATGSGASTATSLAVPAGGTPVGVAAGNTVTVSWPAVVVGQNPAVSASSYVVRRWQGSGANAIPATIGGDCAVEVATLNCTDRDVPNGTWSYTVEPRLGRWAGAPGPRSAAVTVAVVTTSLEVTASASNVVAGTAVTLTVRALAGGEPDPTFAGTRPVVITGAAVSPNGTAPTLPATLTFNASGVATAQVTLTTTGTAGLGLTVGGRSASTTVVVTPAALNRYGFVNATRSCASGSIVIGRSDTWIAQVGIFDRFGNIGVNGNTAFSISSSTSGDIRRDTPDGTLRVAANANPAVTAQTVVVTTRRSNSSGSLTVSGNGFTLARCTFSWTN